MNQPLGKELPDHAVSCRPAPGERAVRSSRFVPFAFVETKQGRNDTTLIGNSNEQRSRCLPAQNCGSSMTSPTSASSIWYLHDWQEVKT
eukprot:3699476-Rhodomonas_salina.3